jgi:hypothetical protein
MLGKMSTVIKAQYLRGKHGCRQRRCKCESTRALPGEAFKLVKETAETERWREGFKGVSRAHSSRVDDRRRGKPKIECKTQEL